MRLSKQGRLGLQKWKKSNCYESTNLKHISFRCFMISVEDRGRKIIVRHLYVCWFCSSFTGMGRGKGIFDDDYQFEKSFPFTNVHFRPTVKMHNSYNWFLFQTETVQIDQHNYAIGVIFIFSSSYSAVRWLPHPPNSEVRFDWRSAGVLHCE